MGSQADIAFKKTCQDIIDKGVWMKEGVRPHWDDGEPAYTKKLFGVVNRYNLRNGEFPLLTLRPISLKLAVDEILWIWQKKSNKIADLGSHIWDSWADENGTIGKAYGYQLGQVYAHHKAKDGESLEGYPSATIKDDGYVYLDQVDAVLWDLRNNPASRRIMTNIYRFDDLKDMGLYPCAYSMTFNVSYEEDGTKVLNAILNQRSQDMLAANAWNVAQYCALTMMIAQATGCVPGEFVHVIADCHIYDRHIPIVEDLIKRDETQFAQPKVVLDPTITDFYKFTPESFKVELYEHGEKVARFPVAI